MAWQGARLGGVLAGALAIVSLVACSSDGGASPPPVDRTAGVYEGIVRWAIDQEPPAPSDHPDKLPVVYVVSVDGEPLGADSQVTIVRELKDEAKVRMADRRDEAIDAGVDDKPVRDAGVLLLVGPVPAGSGPVEVPVTVYRDAVDERALQLRLDPSGAGWVVTSVTVTKVTTTTST